MTPPRLRILADDLTGALDSAARFVPLVGPVPTVWDPAAVPDGVAAIDSGTREATAEAAAARVRALLPLLAGAQIAFKKIDSLLRGPVAAELGACVEAFGRCIVAPAFPWQGRVTIGGRQHVRDGDGWRALDTPALPLALRDARSDADLARIVATERGRDVLWVGTGGLAGALAGGGTPPRPRLSGPILALIGSDHGVTAAQIASLGDGDGASCLVRVTIPPDTARDTAAAAIAGALAGFLVTQDPRRWGTLFVTGGETLRAICITLGATRLDVDGEVEPGAPSSILRGGTWDGIRVVSKSGAFGDDGFLARLFALAGQDPPMQVLLDTA